MLSDDSTSDSDSGIRFKTDSTRRHNVNPDNPGSRGGRGRDNRRADGPERSRDGPFGGNRDRFDRRGSPKPRERSPFREKNRNTGDRYSRNDRGKDLEHHRFNRGSSKDRERPRDHHESTKPRGDTNSRNGTKNDQSRNRFSAEIDRRRDGRRDQERDVRSNIVETERRGDSRKETEKDSSRQRDVKEKVTLKRDISVEDITDVKLGVERYRNNRESSEKGGHSKRYDHESDRVGHSEHREKPQREVVAVVESRASKIRAKSPIRFRKSPSPQVIIVQEETSRVERERRRKTEKSPTKLISKVTTTKVQKYESDRISETFDSSHEQNESELELSDVEPKPVSYYSMVSNNFKTNQDEPTLPKAVSAAEEPIALSDDSEDDVALRKQLLLIKKELKKTKKKTKHKEKKSKKSHKKSKNSKSGSDTMSNSEKSDLKIDPNIDEAMAMKVTITSAATSTNFERRVISQSIQPSNNGAAPQLKKTEDSDEEGEIVSEGEEKVLIDTSDLRHRLGRQIGPMLPSVVQAKSKAADLREKLLARGTESPEVSGLALPPHLRGDADSGATFEGPVLPPHLIKGASKSKVKKLGPNLPADMRERLGKSPSLSDNDDDVVGPLPVGSTLTQTQRKLEERALQMRIGALGGSVKDDERDTREEWMLELPDVSAARLGLGPRQFRAKAGPDLSDRSSWTDTPEQKALKASGVQVRSEEATRENLQREAELQFIRQRDADQEHAIKKHKKKHKRDESLVELHQRKLEKKKRKEEKESGHAVRRPFNRDIDLKANKFDEAQKKSIMKKAQLLDTRFSSGQSKFL